MKLSVVALVSEKIKVNISNAIILVTKKNMYVMLNLLKNQLIIHNLIGYCWTNTDHPCDITYNIIFPQVRMKMLSSCLVHARSSTSKPA